MNFSIIIPVFNRPNEIFDLLESLSNQDYTSHFEVIIIEDGSTNDCESIVTKFHKKIDISYHFKENSGPGNSRNYGMQIAKGDYFLLFDSDCKLPKNYLSEVSKSLSQNFVDCFGGGDTIDAGFTNIQKAINFALTSPLTSGGIRGANEKLGKFQPRSFNMGLSRKAFEESKGFGNMHPGEDPDLVFRLWDLGFQTQLLASATVVHKRRIDFEQFKKQVNKFGKARVILNFRHPKYVKPSFFAPAIFVLGFFLSLILIVFLHERLLQLYFLYFVVIFCYATYQNRNPIIGGLSVVATWHQFYNYGIGFIEAFYKINIMNQKPEIAFPVLFFKNKNQFENNIILKKKIDTKPISNQSDGFFNDIIKFETKIIGLTGGIGSGKTAVANYFEFKGFPVYNSDLETKKLMQNPVILAEIRIEFGDHVFDELVLNRQNLAKIVFENPDKLAKLNAIVHPYVKIHFEQWLQKQKAFPFVIKEAAILFESKLNTICFKTITVNANVELRIQRVMNRDKVSYDQVLSRIKNQWTDEMRSEMCDFIIDNSDLKNTERQIDLIIANLQKT